jgi:hypothetical protein
MQELEALRDEHGKCPGIISGLRSELEALRGEHSACSDLISGLRNQVLDLEPGLASKDGEMARMKEELRSKPATSNVAASPSADAELSQERQRLFMGFPTGKDVDAVRKRIRTAVLRSVKKAKHNSKTKPWTEVVEAMTPDMADALCADLPLSSDGKEIKRCVTV